MKTIPFPRTSFLVILVFMPLMAYTQNVYFNQTNGPEGGRINTIVVSNEGKIFGGTRGGVFIYDQDEGWRQHNVVYNCEHVTSMILGPENTIFAGTWVGYFYRSLDSGNNWERGASLRKEVQVLEYHEGKIYALTRDAGILISEDQGENWSPLNNGITTMDIRAISFGTTGQMTVATKEGIFTSENDGADWEPSSSGISDTDLLDVAAHPDGTLYAISPHHLYSSPDLGLSWSRVELSDSIYYDCLEIDAEGHFYLGYGHGHILLVSGGGEINGTGVLYSDDGGSWTLLNSGISNREYIQDLYFGQEGKIYALGSLLYRSDNNGNSWSSMNKGLKSVRIDQMLRTWKDFILATDGWMVYLSKDRGESWDEVFNVSSGDNISCMALNPQNGDVYAYQNYFGLHVSENDGDSWTSIKMEGIREYSNSNSMALNSKGHIYLSTQKSGLMRSMDGGTSWDTYEGTLEQAYSGSVFIDSDDRIFVSVRDSGLYRSDDDGELWLQVNNGFDGAKGASLFAEDEQGSLYLYSDYNIYTSDDSGDNWNLFEKENDSRVRSFFIHENGDFFASHSLGVKYLAKGSDRWEILSAGMDKNHVARGVVTDSKGYIYASILYNSIYRSQFPTGIKLTEDHAANQSGAVGQNYPNPFFTSTTIPFYLHKDAPVMIHIYNSVGMKVRSFNLHRLYEGHYNFEFTLDGCTPGLYYCELITGAQRRKVIEMIYSK